MQAQALSNCSKLRACTSRKVGRRPDTVRGAACRVLRRRTQSVVCASRAYQEDRPTAELWPTVDWRRQNVQVLFVDRTDTVRARLACGIFETVAEWNGFGRVLCVWSSGVQAAAAHGIENVGKVAALASYAKVLGILPRYFARVPEQFERDDLDRYDLIIALDRSVYSEIMSVVEEEHLPYYNAKVTLLTLFSQWESDYILTRVGGFALLPSKLSQLLRDHLPEARSVVDVPTPQLNVEDAAAQWSVLVQTLILACGGLCKYLIDAHPEDDVDPDA